MAAERTRFLSVKNYERYQHYKDRNPTWIKLYLAMLDDPALMTLSETSRYVYVGCLILAARTANRIPSDLHYLSHALHMNDADDVAVCVRELTSAGFLGGSLLASCYQPASTSLSNGYQPASNLLAQRKSKSKSNTPPPTPPHGGAATTPSGPLSDAEQILGFLNKKTGRTFPARNGHGPTSNLLLIADRLREGWTVEQCRAVIALKCREWAGREWPDRRTGEPVKGDRFLRPVTLFAKRNFETYIGELSKVEEVGNADGVS